jgi:hypothetical protein
MDPLDELPPPTCAEPTEFDAVLLPPPPIVVGAAAVALWPATPADAVGDAVTPPVCTAPTELEAVLLAEPTETGAEAEAAAPL